MATSDPNETRLIVERAQAIQPGLDFVVRTHSDTEAAQLRALGGKVQVVHGERELAVQMARYALRRFGVSATEAEAIAQGLRGRGSASPADGPDGPVWWTGLRDRSVDAARSDLRSATDERDAGDPRVVRVVRVPVDDLARSGRGRSGSTVTCLPSTGYSIRLRTPGGRLEVYWTVSVGRPDVRARSAG